MSESPETPDVNVTELRQNLPTYLRDVAAGATVYVTHHGRPIAKLVPVVDEHDAARARLAALRETAEIGDIESPIDIEWDAAR